jgi:uncharacterized protein (DUF3820 family)
MADVVCNRCGLVNDYTTREAGPHVSAVCNGCDRFIKHIPQDKPFLLPFGKYKGTPLTDMVTDDQVKYLHWLKGVAKENLALKIDQHLKTLEVRNGN